MPTWSVDLGGQGDGGLVTSHIMVNQAGIIGSPSGQVHALDARTGGQPWTANVGGAITAGNGNVISALAAGDGLLVVPAGNTVTSTMLRAESVNLTSAQRRLKLF